MGCGGETVPFMLFDFLLNVLLVFCLSWYNWYSGGWWERIFCLKSVWWLQKHSWVNQGFVKLTNTLYSQLTMYLCGVLVCDWRYQEGSKCHFSSQGAWKAGNFSNIDELNILSIEYFSSFRNQWASMLENIVTKLIKNEILIEVGYLSKFAAVYLRFVFHYI